MGRAAPCSAQKRITVSLSSGCWHANLAHRYISFVLYNLFCQAARGSTLGIGSSTTFASSATWVKKLRVATNEPPSDGKRHPSARGHSAAASICDTKSLPHGTKAMVHYHACCVHCYSEILARRLRSNSKSSRPLHGKYATFQDT